MYMSQTPGERVGERNRFIMVDMESPSNASSLINDDLRLFLKNKVNSFIKWDLVRFFHDNPHTKDTAENIARYTGRDMRTIQRELDSLVKSEVLVAQQIADVKVYALSQDDKLRMRINDFIGACHDRQFRVAVIHEVIDQMQFSPRHDF